MAHAKVPVFLLFDKDAGSMEFYEFHSKFFHGDSEAKPTGAIPFTTFSHFPDYCNFITFEGKILVIGGKHFCDHVTTKLYDILIKQRMNKLGTSNVNISEEEIIRIVKEEDDPSKMLPLPSLVDHPIYHRIRGPSNRTKAFDFQKFIDNNEKPGLQYADFDEDTQYWNSCPGLQMARIHCHLLPSQGRVLSLVTSVDYSGLHNESEVFNGLWHHVSLPVQLHPLASVASAAVHDHILIGTNISDDKTSFVLISPDFSNFVPLEDVECPPQFLLGCSELPGFVVNDHVSWDDTIVVWHDKSTCCISGLHLGHRQHFNINLVEENIVIPDFTGVHNIYRLANASNLHDAQLISIGDEVLAMIYRGLERYSIIDDRGKVQHVADYRYVTFEVIYHNPDYPARVPYPGIQVKTRILSNLKCYAPCSTILVAAFAMDVYFPHKVKNPSSDKKRAGAGIRMIVQ